MVVFKLFYITCSKSRNFAPSLFPDVSWKNSKNCRNLLISCHYESRAKLYWLELWESVFKSLLFISSYTVTLLFHCFCAVTHWLSRILSLSYKADETSDLSQVWSKLWKSVFKLLLIGSSIPATLLFHYFCAVANRFSLSLIRSTYAPIFLECIDSNMIHN